ncbi:MAG: hypothetical protein AAGG50_13925 [Bacteroidota bacterium]
MWKIDKSRAKFSRQGLTAAEQNKFDAFKIAVHQRGMHPKDAAKAAGDTNYKQLIGDQYQIRLSQGNRVTFTVNTTTETVHILQVGGHT